jgi:hypothetical protein
MKTSVHFLSYLTQFLLEWEMSQTELTEKIETHIFLSSFFFLNHAVYEIMWKYVESDRPHLTKWHIHVACWITKATNTHSECVILIFHYNSGCTNMPQCYIVCTLPILFSLSVVRIEFWVKWCGRVCSSLGGVFWKSQGSNLDSEASCQESLYGFPQPIQAYVVIVPQLRSWLLHCRLLPNLWHV